MTISGALPGPSYENTLIGRCMRAYDEAPAWGVAHPDGIALVLEHLAAEVMAQQHMRGAMDAHEVARMLLEGAHYQKQRIAALADPIDQQPSQTSADNFQACEDRHG